MTMGVDWTVLELEKGKQIFLFVPVTDNSMYHSLVYYEFVLNPSTIDNPKT